MNLAHVFFERLIIGHIMGHKPFGSNSEEFVISFGMRALSGHLFDISFYHVPIIIWL